MSPVWPNENTRPVFYRLAPSGSQDFRISNIGYDDFSITDPMMVFRKQTEYTLHFVLEGRGFIETEGASYTVSENQLFFIPPGESFRYYADENAPWKYVWFGFEGRMAGQYAALFGFDGVTVRPPQNALAVRETVLELFHRAEGKGADETDAIAAFLRLVFLERCVSPPAKPKSENLAERASHLIDINYRSPTFTVGVLAEMLHLSHPYLSRLYKKERGITPESEIIGKRLRLAASLLCTTAKPVYEVARASGYRDELHFAKAFHNHYGASPRVYRKTHGKPEKA